MPTTATSEIREPAKDTDLVVPRAVQLDVAVTWRRAGR